MSKHLLDAFGVAIGITIGWMTAPALPPPFAAAQGSAMEEAVQTNIMRDTLRTQASILEELRTLNDRLRAADCLRRLSYGAQYQCNKGEELPLGKEQR